MGWSHRPASNGTDAAFAEVLVEPTVLVQRPNGRFEAMDHVTPCIGIEALVVDAGDPKGDPDVTGLGQKGAIVDESPDGEQPVDAAGSLVVPQDAPERHHGRTSTSKRVC